MNVFERRWPRFSGRLGLRSKFVLINVSMILGVVGVLTLYFISIQRSMLHNELRNRAISLAKNFSHDCGYPVLLEDMPVIRQMAMGIMKEEDVAFVQVRGMNGRVLFEEVREPTLHNWPGWEEIHAYRLTRSLHVSDLDNYLIVSVSINKPFEEELSFPGSSHTTQENRRLGESVIGFSLDRTKGLVASSIASTLLITIGIGMAGILMALMVVRHLVMPLLSVMKGTREIASGNLSYRVDIHRDDELGLLAGSFNDMAAKLGDNRRVLDEYSRDLEKMVFDRTLELRKREEELTLILENNPAGILLVDTKTNRINWSNSNGSRMLEGSKEQIEGHQFQEYIPPEAHDEWAAAEPGKSREARECRLLTVEGREIPVLVSVSHINYKGGEHRLNAFFDITERKKLEAQLLQAQKLGAIGTLAGGIAHDFNNLLQAVSGYVQLVLLKGMASGDGIHYLNLVERSVQRGTELVKQLLTFSSKVESQLRPLDLNLEVDKISRILARTLPKMVAIETDLHGDLNYVEADPAHLEQMIMNLAVNARDAMPQGGRLVFRTDNVTLDEECCKRIIGVTPGSYVLLSIADTGAGMDETTLEHVFEPFYTTKEMGKGTGLGLAMVYGIVKSHHGHITCSSSPGQGTIFEIYLPVLEGEKPPREEGEVEEVAIRGGNETILLVDDDDLILSIGREILEPYGYQVITAESGEKAVEIYRNEMGSIRLVALDLGMPGMGGYRCLKEVLSIDPDARIIIASGYSDMEKKNELLSAGARAFLGKPYRYHDMLKVVRDVLDDKPSLD